MSGVRRTDQVKQQKAAGTINPAARSDQLRHFRLALLSDRHPEALWRRVKNSSSDFANLDSLCGHAFQCHGARIRPSPRPAGIVPVPPEVDGDFRINPVSYQLPG